MVKGDSWCSPLRYISEMNRFTIVIIFFALLLSGSGYAQNPRKDNLVPNPSFEEFSDPPSGWYYSGRDFSRVALYWTSATAASPDIYAPNVMIPPSWSAVGFGRVHAYSGVSNAGITVYGCENGKPHCREYIQVQLNEPLVPGQVYTFSCMLAHLQKSVMVKNIGLWFSDYEVEEMITTPMQETPVLTLDRFIPSDGRWYRWSGQFKADQTKSYLLIGNFSDDEHSVVKFPTKSDLRFGYYYVDEVRLFKVPPILPVPETDSPLLYYHPKPGEIVTLGNIYFEYDRSDFMPRAVKQLNDLLAFMERYPTMRIEIRGHTDIMGTAEYNQELSLRRARAVAWFLKKRGIAAERLETFGFGATQPIGSNDNSQGRSLNRRVEIKVLSL
jgi:OOP family OmpA-OmpF porin